MIAVPADSADHSRITHSGCLLRFRKQPGILQLGGGDSLMGERSRLVEVQTVDDPRVRQRCQVFKAAPASTGTDFVDDPALLIDFADRPDDVERHLSPFDGRIGQLGAGKRFIIEVIGPDRIPVRCEPPRNFHPVFPETFLNTGDFPHLPTAEFTRNFEGDRNHLDPRCAGLLYNLLKAIEKDREILRGPGRPWADAVKLESDRVGSPVIHHIPERLPVAEISRLKTAYNCRRRTVFRENRLVCNGLSGTAPLPVLLDRFALPDRNDRSGVGPDHFKNAEQGVLTARNNLTTSYKTFANQLNNVKGVIDNVGGHAKNLADVFSDEVGAGIGKAIDFIDEVLDATSTVISAIGDVGKNVASAMSSTVSAASTGMQASATAAAASISTVEKASVILAVISAALQIATAIAGLFNNDEEYQEEIERLQGRIDQLQWELDNADVVRMQDNSFDSLQKLQDVVRETTAEVLKLHNATAYYYSSFYRLIGPALYQSEIYQKSIEKIADAYADIEYSADKALGAEKYESSRSQLENLAEQQLAIQQQINAESSKKDSDSGKIEEWKRDIQEIGQEMVAVINEMVEDIIGGSAADIAEQLGDAFFDAFREGEDAAKAWKDTVDDIVSDIVKRMLVTELLEKPIGQLFDRYKTKWFGDDGTFKGIDAINNSMGAFANELYGLVNIFSEGMEGLPDELKDIILGDAETTREGTQKGIATASQESVDENNARLTTIQGHTYSIMTGVVELNRIGNLVLERLMGIENNTAETNTKLDNLDKRVSKVSSTLNDIQLKGLRIQR